MGNIATPAGRVSYPKVFKPQLNKLSKKIEYSITLLFPKGTDFSKLNTAMEEAGVKKWGEDKKKWPKGLRNPIRKNEERAKEDEKTGKLIFPQGYESGGFFMNLKSEEKPGLCDFKTKDEILDNADFYAGCWARATVSCYAYSQVGNNGFGFGLQNLFKMKDGDPLSGRPTIQEDFAAIEGMNDDDDDAEVESSDDLFS